MNVIERGIDFRIKQGIMLTPDTKPVLKGYKFPLTKVQDGFGYIGTLAYNQEKTHVQCHLCGFYFKSLGHHLMRSHALSSMDYRDRFGLMRATSLGAPKYIDLLRERTGLLNRERKPLNQAQLDALQRGRDRVRENKSLSLEVYNKRGRCPEQLLRKIEKLAKELGKTPTRREFIKKYGDNGDLDSIYRTYGSWNGAVAMCGLQPNKKGRQPR